jgi:methylated-DNA-[protein]-cysteine S-methyltransferase
MQKFSYDILQTPWGWVGVIASAKGIRRTTLPAATPDQALSEMEPEVREADEQPGAFREFHRQVEEYLNGERTHWDVELDLEGATEFFRQAWEACQSIPAGETRTYGWLAAEAGRPGASRAAGQAMARNPIPLVIPCHRVIGSDGHLHGFGGSGLPLKARLLALDRGTATPVGASK